MQKTFSVAKSICESFLIQREIVTGQSIQHLHVSESNQSHLLPVKIKRNSHMLISLNTELPRSFYLNMQRGSQCHSGNVYRSVTTATSAIWSVVSETPRSGTKKKFLSIHLSCYGGYTLELNRLFNQLGPQFSNFIK